MFLVAGGQISPSPIDFHHGPYNTLTLPCECDTYFPGKPGLNEPWLTLWTLVFFPYWPFGNKKHWLLWARYHSVSQPTVSEHWRKYKALTLTNETQRLFNHHQDHNEKGTAPFMLAPWYQYHNNTAIPVSEVLALSGDGPDEGTSDGAMVVSATGCTIVWMLLTISSMQTKATDRP